MRHNKRLDNPGGGGGRKPLPGASFRANVGRPNVTGLDDRAMLNKKLIKAS